MASDIITLGIGVDSRQVKKGAGDLDKLTTSAKKTQNAVDKFGNELKKTDIAMGRFIDNTGKMREANGRFVKGLEKSNKTLKETSTSTRGLVAATTTLLSVATASKVIGYADAWTNAQNSIRQVTRSSAELADVTDKLRKSAQDSRSSFSTTTDLYAKLKRASDNLGLSQRELIDITTTINKSFAASGATATEAENAIRQLAQGLSAGALRGDEFNSVAEQAPGILRAIAASTGMATGELREFAATGGITAKIIVKALQDQASAIDNDFNRSMEAFGQQMQEANDNATEFIGTSVGVKTAVSGLGDSIVFVSENLGKAATVVGVLGTALAATAVVAGTMLVATRGLTVATVALNLALSLNPFLLVARVVGVALVAIGSYVGMTKEASEAITDNNELLQKSNALYDQQGKILGHVTEQIIAQEEQKQRIIIASAEAQITAIGLVIQGLQLQRIDIVENTKAWMEQNAAIDFQILSMDLSQATILQSSKRLKELSASYKNLVTPVDKATKSTSKLTDAQKKLNKSIADGKSLFKSTRTEGEKYDAEIKRINDLLEAGHVTVDTYSRAVKSLSEAFEESTSTSKDTQAALKEINDQQQKTFDSWSNNITNIITGTSTLKSVLNDLARTLLQKAFVNPLLISVGLGASGGAIAGGFGGGSVGGLDISTISKLLSGGGNSFGTMASSFATSSLGQSLGLSTAGTGLQITGEAAAGLTSAGSALTGAGGFFDSAGAGSIGGGISGAIQGFQNSGVAGGIAGGAGGFFGAKGGAALGSFAGPIGSAIGAALGGLLGGSLGGSLFGTKWKTKGLGLRTGIDGLNLSEDSSLFEFQKKKKSFFRGSKKRKVDIGGGEDITNAFSQSLDNVGMILTSWSDELGIDLLTNAESFSADFNGKLKNVEAFFADSIEGIFKTAFAGTGLLELAKEGEDTGAALERVLAQYQAINSVFGVLDLSLGDIALDAVKHSDDLVTAFGGLANLTSQSSVYYDNFFTNEERRIGALDTAQSALDSFNETIGMSGDAFIDTRAEFRAYIESLDLTAEAGQRAMASALGLQGALLLIASTAESAKAGFFSAREDLLLNVANDAFRAVKDIIASERSAIKSKMGELNAVINAVSSSRTRLRGGNVLASGIDRTSAQRIVSRAASGEAFSERELKEALSVMSKPAEGLFSSFVDYQRDFFKTSIDMENIKKSTEGSLSTAENSLSSLQAMEDSANKQIDALNGINNSVIGLGGAITSLAGAMAAATNAAAAVKNASSTIGGIGTGSDTGAQSIEALYTSGLGRAPDAAGLAYWKAQLASGMSFGSLKNAFFNAAEINDEPTINAFANGGTHNGGIRLVGERGPELELTGPSRIMSNSELMSGMNGSDKNTEHESKMNMLFSKILLFIERSYRLEQKWDADALNVRIVT